MPVPAQNIIYRDYAKKNKLDLKLSVNELFFPNCFLQLLGLLDELDEIAGVLMCSQFMLPEDKTKRKFILDRFISSQTQLHFVLESIIIRNDSDINALQEIFLVNKYIRNSPSLPTVKSIC